MNIDIIAGARPNFMKIAPIIREIKNRQNSGANITFRLIHTGQHYDKNMSQTFFDELGIPAPDVNLGAGGGSQAEQTSKIMTEYEKVLAKSAPDLCIVVGDVTSTLACSVTAKKMGVKVAHVEAGIRSGDWTMPEEINRLVTDRITDFFFTTTKIANQNLLKEGVAGENIFLVGNTMIDTLLANTDKFSKPDLWNSFGLEKGRYFVMTLHRPANVDEQIKLKKLIDNVVQSSGGESIVFPVHPRTRNILDELDVNHNSLHLVEPLGYLEFIYLVKHARAVITDSGGITEETTVLGVPCLTLRDNTERPETVTAGTNELIGTDPEAVKPAMDHLMKGNWKMGSVPEMWDGKTAERIIDTLLELENKGRLKKETSFVDHKLLF
ncbi:MAG: UDP-N-acetylglucosamine 2-epimerase (non-hydrolyzing) [Cyclobacteriaceae bacterium]|nr:UDP-N-acetylglucosamine 2-epimerase (non-hydrolyzing) [Cyclobacteriaceae bacterium]